MSDLQKKALETYLTRTIPTYRELVCLAQVFTTVQINYVFTLSLSHPPQVVHSVYVDIYRCIHVYVYIPTLIHASVCLCLEGENPIV